MPLARRELLLRLYLALSGLVFLLVALFHAMRIARGWEILVAGVRIPHELSWLGFPVSALYAICAFALLAIVAKSRDSRPR